MISANEFAEREAQLLTPFDEKMVMLHETEAQVTKLDDLLFLQRARRW